MKPLCPCPLDRCDGNLTIGTDDEGQPALVCDTCKLVRPMPTDLLLRLQGAAQLFDLGEKEA